MCKLGKVSYFFKVFQNNITMLLSINGDILRSSAVEDPRVERVPFKAKPFNTKYCINKRTAVRYFLIENYLTAVFLGIYVPTSFILFVIPVDI